MPVSSKEFLDIQATIECGFTLKCVRDITRTYSQMHRTNKYSQDSSIIWSVWPNGWVFVSELSSCGFECSCTPNYAKYIITPEFNKLTAEDFKARLKEADLVTNTDFDKKLTNFNRKITSNKIKYLEIQKKLNSLITKDFLSGKIYFTSNDWSQNTFFYQSTLDTLELKEYKVTDYALSWKSKRVFNSKLKPLYNAFLHSIKLSQYKMGIKFDKDPLAVEQNKFLT